MATHSSVLAWRIPGMGEPGGLPSMGSHRVRHDWSDLAAAAAFTRGGSEAHQEIGGLAGGWWHFLCLPGFISVHGYLQLGDTPPRRRAKERPGQLRVLNQAFLSPLGPTAAPHSRLPIPHHLPARASGNLSPALVRVGSGRCGAFIILVAISPASLADCIPPVWRKSFICFFQITKVSYALN